MKIGGETFRNSSVLITQFADFAKNLLQSLDDYKMSETLKKNSNVSGFPGMTAICGKEL